MFEHMTGLDLPELSSETTENGRYYVTPEGNKYPSVTTVLGAGSDKTWIEEWKARVGEEQVAKVSAQASRRGTAVHEIAEHYLKNRSDYKRGHMPANIASFNYIKPYLDKHITLVGGLELPLYSDKLRVAGRVDCLAKWDGEYAIIDFKTSKRAKDRDSIHGYFMQASCYSYMVYERLGILPKKIVIVMTVDDAPAQIFVEKSRDWLPKFIELREKVSI
jgi:genome maintenance exonuclease 1